MKENKVFATKYKEHDPYRTVYYDSVRTLDDGTMIFRSGKPVFFTENGSNLLQEYPFACETYIWPDRWWNLTIFYDAKQRIEKAYVNIGLPPSLFKNMASFCDLDLDVAIDRQGFDQLLDADEFDEANYPDNIRKRAVEETRRVLEMVQRKEPPFRWENYEY